MNQRPDFANLHPVAKQLWEARVSLAKALLQASIKLIGDEINYAGQRLPIPHIEAITPGSIFPHGMKCPSCKKQLRIGDLIHEYEAEENPDDDGNEYYTWEDDDNETLYAYRCTSCAIEAVINTTTP